MSAAAPATGDLRTDPRALASHIGDQPLVTLHYWVDALSHHLRAARDGRVLDASAGMWSYDLRRACDEVTNVTALLDALINAVYPPTDDDDDDDPAGVNQADIETEYAGSSSDDDDAPALPPAAAAPAPAADDDDDASSVSSADTHYLQPSTAEASDAESEEV